jgi:RNA polymerase sigma-70 factor, ECF subfamily
MSAITPPQTMHPPGANPSPQESHAADIEGLLLQRMAGNDATAVDELYRRYATPLYSLIYKMVGDTEEASEILQDAFVKLWRRANTFDPKKSKAFTWTVMLVRGLCIDHLRKRGRRAKSSHLYALEHPEDVAREGIVEDIIFAERAQIIRRALHALSDRDRECIELSFFSDVSHQEIAKKLSTPVGTIKSRLRRALLQLRLLLPEKP